MQLFTPLVQKCKSLGRAMRIGTNHGSLSARILSYYGDTPRSAVMPRRLSQRLVYCPGKPDLHLDKQVTHDILATQCCSRWQRECHHRLL